MTVMTEVRPRPLWDFFKRRQWLVAAGIITPTEYGMLLSNVEDQLPEERRRYLLAFIDGWKTSRR